VPMFDETKLPYKLELVLVQGSNHAVDCLRSRMVSEIILAEPPHGFRLSNKVRALIQAHIRRCLTFVDAGLAEYTAGRPLVTDLCSRAIYENVAAFHDFVEKIKPLLLSADYQNVGSLIMQTAFATRVQEWLDEYGDEYQATNIITQIKKLAKINPRYADAFDRLCDIVHPNGLGSVVYFSIVDETTGIAKFSEKGNDPEKAYASLVLAAVLLLRLEKDISELEPMLNSFSKGVR
jgi:hypothetical protein